VVLFSLIMAVGMLVDGAIVVTELADRKMAEGLEPRRLRYRCQPHGAADHRVHAHHACCVLPAAVLAGHHRSVHALPADHA
jgi:Cu/Ag efflux pump CusA